MSETKNKKPQRKVQSTLNKEPAVAILSESKVPVIKGDVTVTAVKIHPYDENLLERSLTQWQFGDWESLAQLDREILQHHPDRAKLALLAAAGHLQIGSNNDARRFIYLARDWGCGKELISRILIAGVHNSLGRAAAVEGQQTSVVKHFEKAVGIGTPGSDTRLITKARIKQQIIKTGEYDSKQTRLEYCCESESFLKGHLINRNSNRKKPFKRNMLRYARSSKNQCISNNKAHQFAARHALCHYHSGVIYSFIPKNGCTNIRYSLAIANGCIDGLEDFDWIHNNNHAFIASMSELVNARYSFVILRCPYSRLASVYLDKVVNEKDVISSLDEIKKCDISIDSISFRRFVDILSIDGAINKNHHWVPQINFLVYQEYSDWFRLEAYDEALRTIADKTGLVIHDARAISQHGTERYQLEQGDFFDTSAKEIAEMQDSNHSPSHASLYDKDLIEKVKQLYAQDISLYEHQFGFETFKKDSLVLGKFL